MPYIFQKPTEPLYPEVLFNRPETKLLAGKLLIIGGNSESIARPSLAYQLALKHGAGEVKVILPNSTKRLFAGSAPEDLHFMPSSPSGSFDKSIVESIHPYEDWADAIFYAGDFSKNSETILALHNLHSKVNIIQGFAPGAIEIFANEPASILNDELALINLEFYQLQKIATKVGFHEALLSTLSTRDLYEKLSKFSEKHPSALNVFFKESIISAKNGHIIVSGGRESLDELEVAVSSTVWLLQQPNDTLKTIASAVINIKSTQ